MSLRAGDQWMLRHVQRRGASGHLAMRRRMRGRGSAFALGWLGPHYSSPSFHVPSPLQPVAEPSRRPQAAQRVRWPSASSFRRACSAEKECVDGVDVARCSRSSRGLRCRTPCSSKEAHGKREQTHKRLGLTKGPRLQAGEDRSVVGCARASLSSVAEVGRRRRTQKSVHFPFHPIWVLHADGGLACGEEVSAEAPRTGRL